MNTALLPRGGTRQRGFTRQQRGFTLIELLIAMVVLMVGLLALAGLVGIAIQSNGRNKVDSTATMLAQTVIEQINSSMEKVSNADSSIVDDAGNTWLIYTESGKGCALRSSDGFIDFTQKSPPTNYYMNYVIRAKDADGKTLSSSAYDVRWHIDSLTSGTYLVTVGAVAKGSPAPNSNLRAFAFPSNLRVMIGSDVE